MSNIYNVHVPDIILCHVSAEKEKRRKQEEEEERKKPGYERKQQRKKRAPRTRKRDEAASASEAIEKILQEKKISSKINYDVLKGS